MTVKAMPKETTVAMTAPMTTARVLLATSAQTLRHTGVRRWRAASTSASSIAGRSRDLRRTRAGSALALAGLRHPAAISATIARPAIQAEAVVSSDNDTQNQMVPGGMRAVRPPARVHRWWAIPLTVIALAAITAILVVSVLPASLRAENRAGEEAEFALVPADAERVADRLAFDAVDRYPAAGEFLFVTVREPEITLLDWFVGEGEPEVGFLSYEDKFGTQTPDQQRQFSVEMMRTAKETAEYVALDHLGYPAEIIPGDVIIADLVCLEANEEGTTCIDFAPSDDLLDPGDKLLVVDGDELETLDDLSPILQRHEPGDVIEIEFERPGEGTKNGEVELIDAGDGSGRTIIGFVPFDTASADLPFEVDIDSGAIGGPSAGLAFTLTLIDELTPGELTGGGQVAVTGTIRIDGTVGAIGGLAQKVSAVRQQGAKVFIVPTEQGEADLARAREVAGDEVQIVPVDNLDQALAALAELGGNGLELGTPGADYEPAS